MGDAVDVVYLDNAATTFPKPGEVVEAVTECLRSYAVSPRRGRNPLSRAAEKEMDRARTGLAKMLGVSPDHLIFMPSATYAINLVLQGMGMSSGDILYISPFEHNAVVRCAEYLRQTRGVQVRELPIDRDCNLDVHEARRWFMTAPPKLVAVVHASNVSGDILPIKEVADLAHEYGAKVLVDGAQTVGAHTPQLDNCGYDFLTFSSHKGLYGIPGSGGLVINSDPELIRPLIYGGTGTNSEDTVMPSTLPERFEAGTHALPSIVSMRAGVQWLESVGIDKVRMKVEGLTRRLINGLTSLGIGIVGCRSRHGNSGVVSFTMGGISPEELNRVLDSEGICVRSGLHCAPLAHHTLGTFPNGTVRVSPGYFNTEADVDRLLEVIEALC